MEKEYQIENYEFQRSEFRSGCQISIVDIFAKVKISFDLLFFFLPEESPCFGEAEKWVSIVNLKCF